MTNRPSWAPEDVDINRPAPARMYDFYLGGSHNFAADRALAARAMEVLPDLPHIARANRAFLRRAVTYAVGRGIDQFIDVGSGIPTSGNVHEIAHRLDPTARIVYVDNDPVAIAHSRTLLAGNERTGIVHADLRDTETVLAEARRRLDFDRPIAVLMFAVLPFVPDEDDPAAVVEAYYEATVPGSLLALSHATNDFEPARMEEVEELYRGASAGLTNRTHKQILGLFGSYELVSPGLVNMVDWRPDPNAGPDPLGGDARRYSAYAAVGVRVR